MSVMTEARMEAKAQELTCRFVFVPVHVSRLLLFKWREPEGLSGVLAYHPGDSFHVRCLFVVYLFESIEEIMSLLFLFLNDCDQYFFSC